MRRRPPTSTLVPYTTHFRSDVESIVRQREQALSDLETLEADALQACRRQLREHLEYIDRGELAKWSAEDRKSTRLNSSHANISYAVFCLKKKIIVRS